jgi:hypothetical protein
MTGVRKLRHAGGGVDPRVARRVHASSAKRTGKSTLMKVLSGAVRPNAR